MLKKILQYALLIVFGVATATAGLEIFGRLIPVHSLPDGLSLIVQTMTLRANTLFSYDPYFRYISRPNVDFLFQHPEFTYRVITKLNVEYAGFRGGTLGGPVWGVAVGDSFTFGMGVEHDATWVAHLASLTRKEILNLGVPGWGPQQYTRVLERFGASLKPKIVFYALYRNDLQDVLLFDHWLRTHGFRQTIESALRHHSITYNFVRLLATSAGLGSETIFLDQFNLKFSLKKLRQELIDDRNNFAPAWSIITKEIDLAVDYSRKMGAGFVLLYLPSKDEVYWKFITQKDTALKSYDKDIDLLRSPILKFCKEREIRCLDLTSAFRRSAAQGVKLYYSGDPHWNKMGNRTAAEEVDRYLLAANIS